MYNLDIGFRFDIFILCHVCCTYVIIELYVKFVVYMTCLINIWHDWCRYNMCLF